jgi:hypothetical protein
VRHVVEHALHVLRTRADAAQEVLTFLVELLQVIAEKQLAESIDGEDRRFQIVRKNAEEADQLILRDRLFRGGCLFEG